MRESKLFAPVPYNFCWKSLEWRAPSLFRVQAHYSGLEIWPSFILSIFQENADEALKSPRRFRRRWTCPLNREFGNMSAGLRSQLGWNFLQNLATAELESVLAVVKEIHLPSL